MPSTPEEPWLIRFLGLVRLRPGSYLGAEDVRSLYLFITAYTMARTDLGMPELGRGEELLLSDFQRWLEKKLGMSDTRGWHGLIERQDSGENNVFTFLRLFDEFLVSQGDEPLGGGDSTLSNPLK